MKTIPKNITQTPEQLENTKTWLAALRSGDFKQGIGCLVSTSEGVSLYCCLGVACKVMGVEQLSNDSFVIDEKSTVTSYPTDEFMMDKFGFINDRIVDSNDYMEERITLSMINDGLGYSFEKIADVIEKAVIENIEVEL